MGKKERMKALVYLGLFFGLAIFSTACKKEFATPEASFHAGFAASETALEDALNISRTFFSSGKMPFSTLNCPVRIDTLEDGRIELTFADSCKAGDNRFRSGRLLLLPLNGMERQVDLLNYSIFTDSSFALNGSLYYSVDQRLSPFLKINARAGFHVYHWNNQKELFVASVQYQRETTSGAATPDVKDDVLSKTGSGSYVLPGEVRWNMNYASSATKRLTIGCIDFLTGQAVFSNGKASSFLFDWGGGTCDSRYTVTISETTTIHNIP